MVVGCVVAGLILAAVMGVTALKKQRQTPAGGQAPFAAKPAPVPVDPAPEPVVRPRTTPLVQRLSGEVRAVKQEMSALRSMDRGDAFEDARVGLLARMDAVREELGPYLDRHANDNAANRLWDRLLELTVMLKKL